VTVGTPCWRGGSALDVLALESALGLPGVSSVKGRLLVADVERSQAALRTYESVYRSLLRDLIFVETLRLGSIAVTRLLSLKKCLPLLCSHGIGYNSGEIGRI